MTFQPLSPNFLIRVPKKEEEAKREKDGELYLNQNYVWMTRNTQCGIIEGISDGAYEEFPEAKVGDILLVHHFVQRSNESSGDNEKFVATEDDDNKFYNVTSKEWRGQNNMSYGIVKNGSIIPHRQYVFLEKEMDNKDGWYQTPEQIYDKLASIKRSIEMLSKTKFTPDIILEIKKREAEMMSLNMSLQAKEYLPYKILFSNPTLGIKNGSTVFVLNIAAQTILEYDGVEYRVIDKKYIAAI